MNKEIDKLIDTLLSYSIYSEDLDDLVHHSASLAASAINNNGMTSQLEYLLKKGLSKQDILKEFDIDE